VSERAPVTGNVRAKLLEKAIQYIRASKRIEMISPETSSASENAI